MSKENETINSTQPELGEIYVFELNNGKMEQMSIGFKNIEEANSFIQTMKESMYYKTIRQDSILITMKVLNFVKPNTFFRA